MKSLKLMGIRGMAAQTGAVRLTGKTPSRHRHKGRGLCSSGLWHRRDPGSELRDSRSDSLVIALQNHPTSSSAGRR